MECRKVKMVTQSLQKNLHFNQKVCNVTLTLSHFNSLYLKKIARVYLL